MIVFSQKSQKGQALQTKTAYFEAARPGLAETMKRFGNRGFTLVEMLVVLTIISILSGVLLTQLDPLAQFRKAKDARRQTDISQIRLGLDSYWADTGCYPQTLNGFVPEMLVTGEKKYLIKIPTDPGDGSSYEYRTDNSNLCPQWGTIFSKLTGLGSTSQTICPLSQMEQSGQDCTPINYSNVWACAISGNIDCPMLASQTLPISPEFAPTITPTITLGPTATPTTTPQTTPTVTITPTVTPTITPTITPTPTTTIFKRVFVTSTMYNGNLGGIAGADAKCQARANAASLGGNWKAWLSDSATDPARRNWWQGEYRLTDGTTVIANNWADLTNGSLQYNISKTENGNSLGYGQPVWTSTGTAGNSFGASSSNYCNDWQSSSGNAISHGRSNYIDSNWTYFTDQAYTGCINDNLHLYCFEQ